jgi:hypothetical protein
MHENRAGNREEPNVLDHSPGSSDPEAIQGTTSAGLCLQGMHPFWCASTSLARATYLPESMLPGLNNNYQECQRLDNCLIYTISLNLRCEEQMGREFWVNGKKISFASKGKEDNAQQMSVSLSTAPLVVMRIVQRCPPILWFPRSAACRMSSHVQPGIPQTPLATCTGQLRSRRA